MALTLLDAFVIPLIAGDVGVPMAGMQLVTTIDAGDGLLAARIADQAEAYRATGPAVGQQIVEVERLLGKHGLAVPPRPNSYVEYVKWSDAVAQAVAAVTGPAVPEGALAALGRGIGELLQTIAVRVVALRLLEAAPDHEVLRQRDARYAERMRKQVGFVEALGAFPTLPELARPHAAQLATFARMINALDRSSTGAPYRAGLEMISGKLAEHTAALRGALGG